MAIRKTRGKEEVCEHNHNCGGIIVSHILFVLGAYFFTKGILTASSKLSGFTNVLSSAIFWGIILVMGGVCAVAGSRKSCCCN